MPRTLPTTLWTQETDVTTDWESEGGIWFILTQALGFLLLETGGKIILEESITNEYIRPRYAELFNDNFGNKILNNYGNQILLNGVRESNIITTNWI